MIFFIVNIKGSYEAKKLLNDGYFVWHEKISHKNLKLFAWKARTIYIFDTSGWHKAGVPTYNNERPVLNISLKPVYNQIVE